MATTTGHAKPVNQKKVVGQLEKIVGSIQWPARDVSVLDRRSTGAKQQRH